MMDACAGEASCSWFGSALVTAIGLVAYLAQRPPTEGPAPPYAVGAQLNGSDEPGWSGPWTGGGTVGVVTRLPV